MHRLRSIVLTAACVLALGASVFAQKAPAAPPAPVPPAAAAPAPPTFSVERQLEWQRLITRAVNAKFLAAQAEATFLKAQKELADVQAAANATAATWQIEGYDLDLQQPQPVYVKKPAAPPAKKEPPK